MALLPSSEGGDALIILYAYTKPFAIWVIAGNIDNNNSYDIYNTSVVLSRAITKLQDFVAL